MVESIQKIQNLLRSKEKLSWEDVSWLEIQAKNYPYFQTLHIWIAKHYLKEEHLLKDHKIQAASTFAVDRNVFRNRLLNKTQDSTSLLIEKSEISKPFVQNKSNSREELLAAVQSRLEELQKSKSEENDSKIEEFIPNNTEIKETLESKIEVSKSTDEINLLVNKISPISKIEDKPFKEESQPIKEELTQPKQSKKTSSSKSKEKEEKAKADEELKQIISDSIKPKDLFYSRLGNELNIDSTDSIDLLLNYLESQKEKKENNKVIKKEDSIIEKFIKNDPKISKLTPDKKGEGEDLTAHLFTNKKFISENLAKIQAKQGYIKEAIEIYEELMLKFPEKKTYFANQIKNLK